MTATVGDPGGPGAPLTLFDFTRCHFFAACGGWISDPEAHGVCLACRRAFGDWLRPVYREVTDADPAPPSPLTTAQRFALVAAGIRRGSAEPEPEPERRRNQICWLCEERHTCTRTPDGRWECATCHE